MIVLVGGPIASGKTTVSNAAAAELRRRGASVAVVDADVVYEMLEPRGRSPGVPTLWRQAHRLAVRIGEQFVGDGVDVVLVEGPWLDPRERAAVAVSAELVILRTSPETALLRVRDDASRGVSKDEAVLRRHYAEMTPLFAGLPPDALVLDTERLGPAEAGRALASFATR